MALTELDYAVRRLAGRQYGLFTVAQVLALGGTREATRQRRRRGLWEAVADGVYELPGAPHTWRYRLQLALLVAGPGAAVSHEAAAALLGLPGFPEGPVEILAPHGRKNHRLPGVRFHESRALPAEHVRILDGLAVTTIERTLFDLCGRITEKRADRAIENSLARRLTTPERLWATWADLAAPSRPGTHVTRKLLLKRGPGYVARESDLEIRFSELLDAHGIAQPAWQVELGDDDFIGRVDCLFRRARLVVELDGRIGHVGPLDEARDAERDKRLRALGFRVRRFRWEDVVLRPRWVLAELFRELAVAA
jgi:hypothetical protein